jgi:hypothetical protein
VGLALASMLLGVEALAEPQRAGAEGLPDRGSATDEPRSTAAKIVLIGRAAADPELPLLFGELLERQGVAVEIARAERFDPHELFGSEDAGVTRVFVVLGDSKQARLRFRGPNGDRYLLRTVILSGGLDAVGRELLGQVVESSVLALLRSTEGLSRAEVTAELERDEMAAGPPPPAVSPSASPRRAERPTRPLGPSPWELRFGLRYTATWSGPELGPSHGPGLAVGVRFRRGPSVGLELGADRRFAQSLSTPALDASLERATFHALFEAGLALSPSQSAFVALGPALELSRARPTSAAADVTPAATKSDLEPAWRAEVRYELGVGPVLLGVAALLEGSFVKTRYELVQAGRRELLAAPAPLRPGAVVTVAVRP